MNVKEFLGRRMPPPRIYEISGVETAKLSEGATSPFGRAIGKPHSWFPMQGWQSLAKCAGLRTLWFSTYEGSNPSPCISLFLESLLFFNVSMG